MLSAAGFPSVGKSTLLTKLTGTFSEVREVVVVVVYSVCVQLVLCARVCLCVEGEGPGGKGGRGSGSGVAGRQTRIKCVHFFYQR